MKVFIPVATRWPAQTGTDYAYGFHDIRSDDQARAMIAAGVARSSDIVPPGGARNAGYPAAEAADRSVDARDDGRLLPCPQARTFTVNAGMPPDFAPGAIGAGVVTWAAGAGVTVVDNRTTGATNPSCSLVQIGKDSYVVIGSKA